MSYPKIQATHQQRQAVIYVRQSSLYQVEHNRESQRRQYQLVERAQALGWPAARCLVIDDDLGVSAAHSANRPGYQRLVSMVALREVGLILGLEVSRLARNSLDWYQLLELAGAFDVLIADEDGVYNPSEFNDRLLLGLKGTLSEVELYQIRTRLERGRLNKARRGELRSTLPVGFDYDPVEQTLSLSADQSVRHAIAHVFRLFRQLRSVRAVLGELRRSRLELPRQAVRRQRAAEIHWQPPAYDAIYALLTNPIYAGVYCYGRRHRRRDPLTRELHVEHQPRAAWEVFLPHHHPGYITIEEFEENQRVLADNRSHLHHTGAARQGAALLQGLVYCQHCGRRMRVCYHGGAPYYTCDAEHRRFGAPICNRASARRVDVLVEELFLGMVNAETVTLSWSYHDRLQEEAVLIERQWREKLQRLEYQADLARRRYEHVDPANRLVAQTLETAWNERLLALHEAQSACQAQRPTPAAIASTCAQMQAAVAALPELWYAEAMAIQDKKELLRCALERVFLESCGKVIRARVGWYGGAVSELDVPKYLFSAPQLYHRVRDLARGHTDAEIAEQLNQAGLHTVKGRPGPRAG